MKQIAKCVNMTTTKSAMQQWTILNLIYFFRFFKLFLNTFKVAKLVSQSIALGKMTTWKDTEKNPTSVHLSHEQNRYQMWQSRAWYKKRLIEAELFSIQALVRHILLKRLRSVSNADMSSSTLEGVLDRWWDHSMESFSTTKGGIREGESQNLPAVIRRFVAIVTRLSAPQLWRQYREGERNNYD